MADDTVADAHRGAKTMGYDETLMYGQYQRDLGDFAKKQASSLKAIKRRDSIRVRHAHKEPPSGFRFYAGKTLRRFHAFKNDHCGCYQISKNKVIKKIGADWIFLTMLGVVMALLSFAMDYVIGKCQLARVWLFEELSFSIPGQYFTWVLFPLIFICFSTGFVHVVGPNAIGSGIPEMKTIFRGVVLKEYLTFKTLVSKVVGLCTSLGCGLPIGKEGPFVHIASIMATLLGKLITSFKGIYENESRNTEMLAAACAVGVACTFAAPIGGVLFSIEVTATYFAVQNYWRGFYSAVCAAFVFRLLAIFFTDEETLTALFKTSLRQEFPFDPLEMTAFCVIGIACGFGGALFVFVHRRMVEFIRGQKKAKSFLQKNRFIFPSVVVFVITSITFPPGFGYYMAGHLTNHDAVNQLFSNFSLSVGTATTTYEAEVMRNWKGPANNVFITLTFFIVMKFWMSALAVTLPVPAGVFMPVFTIGAAFGRLVGECMATWYPYGIGGHLVVPGGYAIVGAAALSGSVTHTISTSVIVFELTGQMAHVLPCVVAVLLSNATAHCLQPSFYDSLIQIKRLPYLPDIINPEAINALKICVEDFMIRDIKFITSQSTYGYVKMLLEKYTFRSFPLVDSADNRLLLGSIQRDEMERMVEYQLSYERKIEYFNQLSLQKRPLPRVTLQESGLSMNDEDIIDGDTQIHYSSDSEDDIDGDNSQVKVKLAEDEENPVKAKSQLHVNWNVPFNLSQMTVAQEEEWIKLQLTEVIDPTEANITVDTAPFQLVERTSLYKTHSLFSLLSLHHAYVTNSGQLRGVVSLKEVRKAIQGHVIPPSTPAPVDTVMSDSPDSDRGKGRFSINKVREDELKSSDSEA